MTRTVLFEKSKEHLLYELRFLLGANKIIQKLTKDPKPGNLINYFKDSAYIHVRNLYEFFVRDKGGNDIHLEDFGIGPYRSSLFNSWEEALNRRVMHLSPGRTNRNNAKEPVGSTQLNELIPDFVSDIMTLWNRWIKEDSLRSRDLQQLLDEAKHQAQDDYDSFRGPGK